MAKFLKHFVRTHITHDDEHASFCLLSLPNEEKDSCVTLVRCGLGNIANEMKKWGTFDSEDLFHICCLELGEFYTADNRSIIIRMS